jgi:hypothetical protein
MDEEVVICEVESQSPALSYVDVQEWIAVGVIYDGLPKSRRLTAHIRACFTKGEDVATTFQRCRFCLKSTTAKEHVDK